MRNFRRGAHLKLTHTVSSVALLGIVAGLLMSRGLALGNDTAIAPDDLDGSAESDPQTQSQVHSLDEYMKSTVVQAPLLGLQIREVQRELHAGVLLRGLLIVAVENEGPAANAGLKSLRE